MIDAASKPLGQRIGSWQDLFALRAREVHVVGAGSVEGAHLLLFLADHGFTRLVGHDFTSADEFDRAFKRVHVGWPMAERESMLQRLHHAVALRYRDDYLAGIERADAIGVTQGWYLYDSNERLAGSSELQSRFFALVQLYLALAPGPVAGVTGTLGKSTTTAMLGDILEAGGHTLIRAGNDRHGQQALDRLETAEQNDTLLLEISNRHLKMLDRDPGVAVVTNVYPNHLDEHGGWDGYVKAKQGMVAHQHPGEVAVLNADLAVTREMAGLTPARIVWFGENLRPSDAGVLVHDGVLRAQNLHAAFELIGDAVLVPGLHNLYNAAAAAAAGLVMGVEGADAARALTRFRGIKHRIQFVWEKDGVRYFDDLNSTTPTASEAALRTLGHNIIWIFGGDDKGLDNSALANTAAASVTRGIAVPGQGTDRLLDELRSAGVPTEEVTDLKEAVARAVAAATEGDSVLLSPACPGFFARYYVGGADDIGFRRLVREQTLGATSPPARRARTPADPARSPQGRPHNRGR